MRLQSRIFLFHWKNSSKVIIDARSSRIYTRKAGGDMDRTPWGPLPSDRCRRAGKLLYRREPPRVFFDFFKV